MQEVYTNMKNADKIVIASPIYMNHITGKLKNLVDRLNPYGSHDELLKGKTIYLITVGQMDENENEDIANSIKEYFESVSEFMEFNFIFLKNFTSGNVETINDVTKMYSNYEEIINSLRLRLY